MAVVTWQKVAHLILFGEAADLIEQEMRRNAPANAGTCQIHRADGLRAAVERADCVAGPGDVVLLSPGGTSFDAYTDFASRGEHFRKLVSNLEPAKNGN
jgi:UDP-N-acetylmuramoylalanine--D-glutamate ligase